MVLTAASLHYCKVWVNEFEFLRSAPLIIYAWKSSNVWIRRCFDLRITNPSFWQLQKTDCVHSEAVSSCSTLTFICRVDRRNNEQCSSCFHFKYSARVCRSSRASKSPRRPSAALLLLLNRWCVEGSGLRRKSVLRWSGRQQRQINQALWEWKIAFWFWAPVGRDSGWTGREGRLRI